MTMNCTKTCKISKIMKKILALFIFSLFLINQNYTWAQDNNENQDRWERYHAEKVSFLTNKLDLTPHEAEIFWPVYNELDKERSEVQRNRRELEKQVREATEQLSNKEAVKLTREYASNLEKEAALNTKYNEKFLQILPPQKVLLMYKAEREFRMYMFRKFRERRDD
jgi:tRNA U34 5-carboxymethylaminomethyl modifying GTPase MnmE/TrmE